MKKIILLTLLCMIFACKGTKKTTAVSNTNTVNSTSGTSTANNFTVEKIARNASAEALQKLYPDANMKQDSGLFDEGTVERAITILYPGTKNEIHLIWENQERKKLYQIVFSENGDWETGYGIKIGSTYEDLVARNAKPIKIYGFGWDYSGAVDWNGGKLEKSNLRVFLKPASEPNPKFYGDGVINPSAEELKKLNLTVGNIIYHLGDD